jgi:PAS domain-containing protein
MSQETNFTYNNPHEILDNLLSVNHGWWCDRIVEYSDKSGRRRQKLANQPYFSPAFLSMYEFANEEISLWSIFRDRDAVRTVIREIKEVIQPNSKPQSGKRVAYTKSGEKKLIEVYLRRIDQPDGTALLASLHTDLTISNDVQWIERNVLDKLKAFVFVKTWDPIRNQFVFKYMNDKLTDVLKPDKRKLRKGLLSDEDFFEDWAQKRAFREDDEAIRDAKNPDLVITREETFDPKTKPSVEHGAQPVVSSHLLTFKTPFSTPSRVSRESGWEVLGIAIDVTSVTDVLRSISEKSRNGLYIKDEKRRFHYVNNELLKLLKAPKERLVLDRTLAEALQELRILGTGPDSDDIDRQVAAFAIEDNNVLAGQTIEEIRELSLQKSNDWLTVKQPIKSRDGVVTHLLGETSPLFPGRLGDILDKVPQCISVKKYYPEKVGSPGEFKLVWVNRSFLKIHNREHPEDLIGKTDADLWPGDPEQVDHFRRRDQLAIEKYKKVRAAADWAELSPELQWARVVNELCDADQDLRCWEFRETTRAKSQTRVLQTTKWVEEFCGTLFVVVVYSDVTKGDTEQRRYHEMTTHNLRGATSPISTARSHLKKVLDSVDNLDARIRATITCLDDTSHAIELFLQHHLKLLKMDVACHATELKNIVKILKDERDKLTRNWEITIDIVDNFPEVFVHCDVEVLQFALNEMLLNSVKAAYLRKEESTAEELRSYAPLVSVTFKQKENEICCIIANNGAGCVDPDAREKLIKAFNSAQRNPFDPDSKTHGLSFCVVAVRAQGGRIQLIPPTNSDKCTQVEVYLPLIHTGVAT